MDPSSPKKVIPNGSGLGLGPRNHDCDQSSTPHKLLRGKFPYANKLSAREMESLTAMCDTFLPSMEISGAGEESLKAFYATSASMTGTPESVSWMMNPPQFSFFPF